MIGALAGQPGRGGGALEVGSDRAGCLNRGAGVAGFGVADESSS